MKRFALPVLALLGCATPAFAANPVTMVKTATTVDDPFHNLNPLAIPGATVEYKVVVTGASSAVTGIAFTDAVPTGTSFCLANLDLLSTGPVVFNDTSFLFSSGLTFPYTAVTNAADNLDFSRDGGATWAYQPSADTNGCDAAITHIRVRFVGTFGVGKTVQLRFRVRLK